MFDFAEINEIRLAQGNHASPDAGLCFMEAVSWFAGEAHSDHPECACPILGTYGIHLNDRMPDDVRDRLLKPLVPLIAGTRDPANEQKRGEFLAMWATNKVMPIVLRASGFADHAAACEEAANLSEATAAGAAAYTAADAVRAAAYTAAAYTAAAAVATASAAYVAAAANAAYADAAEIWSVAVEGLRQAIMIGKHEGFNCAVDVLERRREKLRELACAE